MNFSGNDFQVQRSFRGVTKISRRLFVYLSPCFLLKKAGQSFLIGGLLLITLPMFSQVK